MRSFKHIFCIFFFINQCIVKSQTQQWQSHYSFFNTVTAAINTNDLIVGSDNSIFIHDTQSNTNLEITTVDGISGETITSLLGLEREILIGHDTGLISKINIDDMKVFNDNSIQRKITIAANRKKINKISDLDNIVKQKLRSEEKNLLIAIYNNQNQRTYVGVKLK